MTELSEFSQDENLDPGVGSCGVCGIAARLNARICRTCETSLGRRMAELLCRARTDRDFAVECYTGMTSLAQRRFATILGDPTQQGDWEPRTVALTPLRPSTRKASGLAKPPLAKCDDRAVAVAESLAQLTERSGR